MSFIIIALLGLGLTNTMDSGAESRLEASFGNALATFAIVRGINAVISVVQGTEVAIEPGGLGVILTPGEIFDPVNDLIERFSWVVLAAGTSLGAQLILLKFGTSLLANILVVVAGGTLLLCMWTSVLANSVWRDILMKSSILLIFLRFLVPSVVLTNEIVYNSILSPTFNSSFEVLENVEQDVQELQEQENASVSAESEQGILSSIGRLYERTTQGMNITSRYREYEARIAGASRQIINMIAVFMFQTIVFPLLFFWLAVKLAGLALSGSFWLRPTDKKQFN